ncbi:MAG TPA: hypothetical protein VF615_25790 [Longimicrobiaceae bacterium]|jgi:hypothetical protein
MKPIRLLAALVVLFTVACSDQSGLVSPSSGPSHNNGVIGSGNRSDSTSTGGTAPAAAPTDTIKAK